MEKQDNNDINNFLGKEFIPTSTRVPKSIWKLIAIDIYGRYIMHNMLAQNNTDVAFVTKDQFEKGFILKTT